MLRNRKISPKIWQPTFLLNRAIRHSLAEVIEVRLPKNQSLQILDVGCGELPYLNLFEGRYNTYTGCDATASTPDIVVCSADNLKFENDTFDVVLCFQVLEHVSNPSKVVNECARVTRPGGTLIATAPFLFPYHASPDDFFRFSESGLRHLAQSAGYKEIKTEPQCRTLETIILLINVQIGFVAGALRARLLTKLLGWLLTFGLVLPLNLVGLLISALPLKIFDHKGFPGASNHMLVAEMPAKN